MSEYEPYIEEDEIEEIEEPVENIEEEETGLLEDPPALPILSPYIDTMLEKKDIISRIKRYIDYKKRTVSYDIIYWNDDRDCYIKTTQQIQLSDLPMDACPVTGQKKKFCSIYDEMPEKDPFGANAITCYLWAVDNSFEKSIVAEHKKVKTVNDYKSLLVYGAVGVIVLIAALKGGLIGGA